MHPACNQEPYRVQCANALILLVFVLAGYHEFTMGCCDPLEEVAVVRVGTRDDLDAHPHTPLQPFGAVGALWFVCMAVLGRHPILFSIERSAHPWHCFSLASILSPQRPYHGHLSGENFRRSDRQSEDHTRSGSLPVG